ncbi:FG-GAP repeat protein [Polystyrenella longa]|uniref:FG-GAP repeat protein n=1 Tax=Polystyrenella longa TaxID=2528007 RepID=A0A518CLH0_9PLAN|nr:CRTAC1 family protein [Polystyrenella longa]QDU80077.1 FG-GAP repeat protein [Polystyrenella longa]
MHFSLLGKLILTFGLSFSLNVLMPNFQSDLFGQDDEQIFKFHDETIESGVMPIIEVMQSHGAAWGDVNGDGWLDLYIGTFHTKGKPNLLLRNINGKFQLDEETPLQLSSRSTGIVFADLDNDGDLDLYVSSMPKQKKKSGLKKTTESLRGCTLFQNNGNGSFIDVSDGNGACPLKFGGRSVAVLDYDGDGLLDLLVGEDPLAGYNGSPTSSSRLFQNKGGLQFEDTSDQVGLPEGIPGLGVAAADVNNDGWPDFFVACHGEGNRLFLNTRKGRFQEAPGSRETFAWKSAGGDNMICGVAFGDVNRDGLLDVVIGQHYDHPWREPVPNRLYLNQGSQNGVPVFQDVTEQVGLVPLPMKAPHVEIQDFDNDGWPDISTSLVKFSEGQTYPVIFRNFGIENGHPKFLTNTLNVNDFPTSEDKAVKRTGKFYEKMIKDHKVIYTAAGPSGDYDNDGRLDLFLANWWGTAPSMLLRNATPGGKWIDIIIDGGDLINKMGIGSRINIYPAGHLGQKDSLLGSREMSVGFGYASGQPAIAHFGLGEFDRIDIEVILPHDKGTVTRRDVAVGERLTIHVNE